jgi:tyrosyl-DNA phosphodiesterase-1
MSNKEDYAIGSLVDPVVIKDDGEDDHSRLVGNDSVDPDVTHGSTNKSASGDCGQLSKSAAMPSVQDASQLQSIRASAKRRWEEQHSQKQGDVNHDTTEVKKGRINDDVDNKLPFRLFATNLDLLRRQSSPLIAKHCRTLRELLGYDEGPDQLQSPIDWLIIFNYMIDFNFLLETVPELVSIRKVICFFGTACGSMQAWQEACRQPDGTCSVEFHQLNPSDPPNSRTNPLSFKIPWGVHHTKMFLMGLVDGTLRVVIHTANLLYGDIFLKAQGAYVQDFGLKPAEASSCEFEQDLVAYLESYRYPAKRTWSSKSTERRDLCSEIRRYDFSSAKVILIPSTPGKSALDQPKGYRKLSDAIRRHVPKRRSTKPIVCQFSSIGSLTVKWLQEVAQAWNAAQSNCDQSYLKLVYPTASEICESVEGYRGGGSVPGTLKNLNKDFLQSLLHKWSSSESNVMHKPKNVPHIKTFYQLTQDESGMEWFCLTSHNLSKAAWGEIILSNGVRRIFTRHWELGVFVAPQLWGDDCKLVPVTSNEKENEVPIPIPFALRPSRYGQGDEPWTVDGTFYQVDEE